MTLFLRYALHAAMLLAVLASSSLFAHAQEATNPAAATGTIVVSVSGVTSDEGEVGCALFDQADAFPMNREAALRTQGHAADPAGVTCRFEGVAPGTYAIAVAHDRNENGETDTNFLGIPKEDWGVSNGARPNMRAPRFDEAAFDLAAGQTLTLAIEVK
ncbi:MAG: DUF2141 domain-containing protein [Bacteroidota bacterium]